MKVLGITFFFSNWIIKTKKHSYAFDNIFSLIFQAFLTSSDNHCYASQYWRNFGQIKEEIGNQNSVVTSKQDRICKQSQVEAVSSVEKQTNLLLSKRFVNMEKNCWPNTQYSRRVSWKGGYLWQGLKWLKSKFLTISKKLVVKYLHTTLRYAIILKRIITWWYLNFHVVKTVSR